MRKMKTEKKPVKTSCRKQVPAFHHLSGKYTKLGKQVNYLRVLSKKNLQLQEPQ